MAGYGDDSGFTDWLAANGYTLPDDAPTAAVLRQRGSTYIDAVYGPRFSGQPTDGVTQERAWPRTGAYAFGSEIADDVIPDAVVNASYRAAYAEASALGSLSTSYTPGTAKVLTRVGEIEWDVVGNPTGGMSVVIVDIEGLLAPFMRPARWSTVLAV